MGVASGCGEQEVGVASGSGWNIWVWLLGVVVRRYIDFLILPPTPLARVHLGGGGGGTRPPLIKSRPPLEIASLQSASHVHRASPPLFFINTHFAPPWINF